MHQIYTFLRLYFHSYANLVFVNPYIILTFQKTRFTKYILNKFSNFFSFLFSNNFFISSDKIDICKKRQSIKG